jgi:hypothetical protein
MLAQLFVAAYDAVHMMPSQLLETPLSAGMSPFSIARNSTVRCTALVFNGGFVYMPLY